MQTEKHQTATILIAEDEPTQRILLKECLEAVGYRAIEAEDGEQALCAFDQHQPDLVLLDLEMPGKNGFEVCRILRASEQNTNIPIVITTTVGDTHSVNQAFEAGATDFVGKPVNYSVLPHRLRYILRAHQNYQRLLASEEQTRFLLYYDTLTGLPNRQLFVARVESTLRSCNQAGTEAAVLLIGSDQIPRINDTLGHKAGDFLMAAAAERLRDCCQSAAGLRPVLVARFSGTGFGVLFQGEDISSSVVSCARSIHATQNQSFDYRGQDIDLKFASGLALYPKDAKDGETLLRNAHAAATTGRGRGSELAFYTESMNRRAVSRLQLESDLRKALENNALDVAYQPKVDLVTRDMVGVEALARWTHPVRGAISPAEFIPAAEECGLVMKLDRWILRRACQQVADWKTQGLTGVKVSANLSTINFESRDLVRYVEETLRETGLSPAELELEVTESALMSDVTMSGEILKSLQLLGVTISVDDFGTGYSSLSYLDSLPIDALKIDRSFIMNIKQDTTENTLAAAIVSLGKQLGLTVVAEGVEHNGAARLLASLQCDLAQGYYFSKPLTADELLSFAISGRRPGLQAVGR